MVQRICLYWLCLRLTRESSHIIYVGWVELQDGPGIRHGRFRLLTAALHIRDLYQQSRLMLRSLLRTQVLRHRTVNLHRINQRHILHQQIKRQKNQLLQPFRIIFHLPRYVVPHVQMKAHIRVFPLRNIYGQVVHYCFEHSLDAEWLEVEVYRRVAKHLH